MSEHKKDVTVTLEERLAKARADKEARDEAKAHARQLRELEILDLEAKYEPELGDRGKGFEIVDTLEGPVVLKLGDSVVYKRFQAILAKGGEPAQKDIAEFVGPSLVHPTRDALVEMLGKRPAIGIRLSHALVTLYGAKEADSQGKY